VNPARPHITVEHILWAGLLMLAFSVRFLVLNQLPVGDSEAAITLGALQIAGHPSPFWTAFLPRISPLYQNASAWLIQLFGASDALVRIPSALAGSALVLTPLLVRRRYGSGLAAAMGFFLALSPSIVTVSRLAGGFSLALLGTTTAILALLGSETPVTRGRTILAGTGLGAAIAAGECYTGLLALLLMLILARLWRGDDRFAPGLDVQAWVGAALLSGVVFASGAGTNWNGLAGIGESFAAWLQGWSRSGSTGIGTFLAMLLGFEPLILGFGLIGTFLAITGRFSKLERDAAIWAGLALAIDLLRVGRQAQDLIWVLLPLAWLAARTLVLVGAGISQGRNWLQVGVLSSALLILASSAGVSLMSFLQGYQLSRLGDTPSILYFILGALLIMAASLIFIFGMEWSWKVVVNSAVITGFLIATSLSIQALWRLNFHTTTGGARLAWNPIQTTDEVRLLQKTLRQTSLQATGMTESIAIQVDSDLPASLAWYLRGYSRASAEFTPGQPPSAAILTPETQREIRLLAEYYGQAFALRSFPAIDRDLPAPAIDWWVLDEGEKALETWTLWVRADIASLGQSSTGSGP
jgi:4-amino-4-deoxy-L-arabinose transferase-like glycosyltransferase